MDDLTSDQIRHGISLMARSSDRFPVNPGQFRNLAMTFKPIAQRPREVTDQSEKSKAWRACQSRMALRLSGMKPPGEPETSFNVGAVLDSVYWDDGERRRAMAEGFASLMRFDQRVFENLKRKFEGAWR